MMSRAISRPRSASARFAVTARAAAAQRQDHESPLVAGQADQRSEGAIGDSQISFRDAAGQEEDSPGSATRVQAHGLVDRIRDHRELGRLEPG